MWTNGGPCSAHHSDVSQCDRTKLAFFGQDEPVVLHLARNLCSLRVECDGCCHCPKHPASFRRWTVLATLPPIGQSRTHHCLVDPSLLYALRRSTRMCTLLYPDSLGFLGRAKQDYPRVRFGVSAHVSDLVYVDDMMLLSNDCRGDATTCRQSQQTYRRIEY